MTSLLESLSDNKIVQFIIQSPSYHERIFKLGFLYGIIVFFALAVIIGAIYVLFFSGPNRASVVAIKMAKGRIFISTGAISSLIKITSESFQNIRIGKIILIREKESLRLHVGVVLLNKEEQLTGNLEILQEKILETLERRLGVSSVKSVDINVEKIVSDSE